MKKTLFGAFALAVLALAGCTKENAPVDNVQNESRITTLIANLPKETGTKVNGVYSGSYYRLTWIISDTEWDEIGLYTADNDTNIPDVTLKANEYTSDDKKTASFVVTDGEIATGTAYTAVYPKKAGRNAAAWKAFLAENSSTPTTGKIIMSAELPAGETMLNFKNQCALFELIYPSVEAQGWRYFVASISGAWGPNYYSYESENIKKGQCFIVVPLVDEAADVKLDIALNAYNKTTPTLGRQYVFTLHVKANAKFVAKYYKIDVSKSTPSSTQDYNTEYVDLGLPSGNLWATCNLGATTPEGKGNYYGWGMTEPYDTKVDKTNYRTYFEKIGGTATIYQEVGTDKDPLKDYILGGSKYNVATTAGIADGIGGTKWDAARQNWKGSWRMPTKAEMQELIDECNWVWDSDRKGYKVTGPNGRDMLLPVGGWFGEEGVQEPTKVGYYRTSSPGDKDKDDTWYLYQCMNTQGGSTKNMDHGSRKTGYFIRPVFK